MYITFEELRAIKHSLPTGSIKRIASELNLEEQLVRNYFGAENFNEGGKTEGLHLQPGPQGGIIQIEDTRILEMAKKIIAEHPVSQQLN